MLIRGVFKKFSETNFKCIILNVLLDEFCIHLGILLPTDIIHQTFYLYVIRLFPEVVYLRSHSTGIL